MDVLGTIANQGGFAVLAAFAIGTIFQLAKTWVGDVKAGAERERALSAQTISALLAVTAGLAVNTEAVKANGAEIAGLRGGIHGVRDLMTSFEARLYELEKKPKRNEPAPPAR